MAPDTILSYLTKEILTELYKEKLLLPISTEQVLGFVGIWSTQDESRFSVIYCKTKVVETQCKATDEQLYKNSYAIQYNDSQDKIQIF